MMNARGVINERITKWNNKAKPIVGFSIACVGTKRCSYLRKDGKWVYDERDAHITSHDAGGRLLAKQSLFRYCRLVAIYECVSYPTSMGY